MIRSYKKAGALKDKLNYYWQYNDVKKLLNEDFVDVFPYQDYGKEFPDASKMYPHLLANRLGISNKPVFNDMVELIDNYQSLVKIQLNDKYSKEEAIDWIEKNYTHRRNSKIMNQLQREFKLSKVIKMFEKQYQIVQAENRRTNPFLR